MSSIVLKLMSKACQNLSSIKMSVVSGAMPGSAFPPSEDWKKTRNH